MPSNSSSSTGSVTFIQPDVDSLRKSSKSILHSLAGLKTTYAASLQERGGRLNTYLQKFDEHLKNSVVELKASLENQSIDSSISTLEALVTALQDQTLSQDDKTALAEEANLIKSDIQKTITTVQASLSSKTTSLLEELTNVKQVVIKERIQSGYDDKTKQKTSLEQAKAAAVKQKNDLVADRDQLIVSLDVMRKRDIFKTFSDYIPSDQEVDGLDLSQPEIAAVKQGFILYKKMIDNISEGLEYSKLADARNKLDKDIEAATLKIQQIQHQLDQVNDELQDLDSLKNIDAERTKYANEADKLINSFTLFSQSLDNLIRIEQYSEITKLFNSMVSYLGAIVAKYGKVI